MILYSRYVRKFIINKATSSIQNKSNKIEESIADSGVVDDNLQIQSMLNLFTFFLNRAGSFIKKILYSLITARM